MAIFAGDTISQGFSTGSAGESFAFYANRGPTGSAFLSSSNITDLGSGDYLLSFTATLAGQYFVRFVGGTSGEEVVGNWDVDAAPVSSAVSATVVTSRVTSTVTQVRREIQDRLDDLLVLTATADGMTNTLFDTDNLYESDDGLIGSQLVCVSGTTANIGKRARIDGSTQEIASLGFSPELPASTATGDVFDLHNLNGAGWRYVEVIRRLNAVLQESFPHVLISRQDTLSAVFDRDSPAIALPDDVTHNASVEFQDRSGDWIEVPPAFRICHVEALTIEIGGLYRSWANGRSVRLNGAGKHPAVSAEADQIYVNPMWLVLEVAARLGAQANRSQTQRSWALEWGKQAQGMWQNAMTPRPNNLVGFR